VASFAIDHPSGPVIFFFPVKVKVNENTTSSGV
jgi:hypothetical protein